MRQKIEQLVKFFIYATFFVPLVVMPNSFIFPFIVPKILLLRSLITLTAGGFILLLAINWEAYRQKWTPLNIAIISFFLSFALSTFMGVDAYHSFWDNHERMLGLFTITHYVVYFFILSSVFKNWTDWKISLRVFLFAGSLVMVVGLLQVADPTLLLNQGSNRVSSTLGNPIYVGGYGLFLSFVAFLLFIKEQSTSWRWVEAMLGVLGILGLFYSGTRGSMVGVLAGIIFMVVSYSITYKESSRVRHIIFFCLMVGALALGILYINRQAPFVQHIPVLQRTLNTTLASEKNSPRWIAWRIAFAGWKDHPLFGWGPNNFFYVFNAHYNPQSLEHGYGETWFDNAHNVIMNTLAVQGLFGILTYLFIFVIAGVVLVRAYRDKRVDQHMMVVGSGFLLAHLAQNVTVFENPTSYLYFIFWLAMINCLTSAVPLDQAGKQKPNLAVANETIGSGLASIVGLVVVLFIFIFNVQPARANIKTLNALRQLNADPTSAATANMIEEALRFSSPHVDDIRNDLGRSVITLIGGNYQKFGLEKSKELFQLLLSEMKKNIVLHPLDIRDHLMLAQFGQVGVALYNDSRYALESEYYLEEALRRSPRRQQIIYGLANLKAQIGKGAEATSLLEGALKDDPKIGESYWRLAYIYAALGQEAKAREIVSQAEKNNITFSDQEKGYLAQVLPTSTGKKK